MCDFNRDDKLTEVKSYAMVIYVTDNHTLSLSVIWVIDSGCTNHACNNREAFTMMTNKRINITLADGSMIQSAGKGTVGDIEDVNYVPQFKHNLLSVHQLTEQGYDITFTMKGGVIMQKRNSGRGQLIGRYGRGLYSTIPSTNTYAY